MASYFIEPEKILSGGGNKTLALVELERKILYPELTDILFDAPVIKYDSYNQPKSLYDSKNKEYIDVQVKTISQIKYEDSHDYIMIKFDIIKDCIHDVLAKVKSKLIIYSNEHINISQIRDQINKYETKLDGKIIIINKTEIIG